jgi:hypothetical protein
MRLAQGESSTMPRRALPLNDFLTHRIVSLLARTNFSFDEIARRMGCSWSVVASIDRKYEVRDYDSDRNSWPFSQEDIERREAS